MAPTVAPVVLAGTGVEWMVEAFGADAGRLASVGALERLVGAMVAALGLTPVGEPRWHQFPAPGGVTGLVLLAESHLAVHTFPEHGSLCLNLFCCAPRPEWDFAAGLRDAVGARRVRVRRVARRYARGAGRAAAATRA
jgi:S-adenosylmethionine decarboxylase